MSRRDAVTFFEHVVPYLLVRAGCLTLPTDLDRLGDYLGVKKVERRVMAAEGFVEAQADGGYKIALRQDRGHHRSRFSFAHELAHILLHKLGRSCDSDLVRQYRASAAVSTTEDEEGLADEIAGALLVPPWALLRWLPEGLSLRRLAELSTKCETSLATTMFRAMWYATQPAFVFHFRQYRGRVDSLQCLWARASRSYKQIRAENVAHLLGQEWVEQVLYDHGGRTYFSVRRCGDAVARVQFYRRHYFDRELIYGLAELPSWEPVMSDSAFDSNYAV
jgi:Zn-dependent peptidase ImmA (M78 family)